MPRVISAETAAQVEELSNLGMTQRQIARRLGICLTTVNRMINGGWQHGGRLGPAEPHAWEVDPATAERCEGCGGLVYLWPCLYCELSGVPATRKQRKPAELRDFSPTKA